LRKAQLAVSLLVALLLKALRQNAVRRTAATGHAGQEGPPSAKSAHSQCHDYPNRQAEADS